MKNLKAIKYIVMAVLVFSMAESSYAQGAWTCYSNTNDINSMIIQGDYLWCATAGGIVRWNISDKTYEKFTSVNGLVHNSARSTAIGVGGTVWFGTLNGILSYENGEWATFIPSVEPIGMNSGNNILSTTIGPDSVVWFGRTPGTLYYENGELKTFTVD